MYFETTIYPGRKLQSMREEELLNLLKEAADKTNTDPESFYIYPGYVDCLSIILLIRSSFVNVGKVSEFAAHCGLEMDDFEFSEISPEQHQALSEEGIGHEFYSKECIGYPDPFMWSEKEVLPVPSKDIELRMPNETEHPKALINEVLSIGGIKRPNNPVCFVAPINYYIVSKTKKRQEAIREALLQTLRMHNWIISDYYKSYQLDVEEGKYNPAMKKLDSFYYAESDYPIVLSINGDKPQSEDNDTLNAFTDTIIKHKYNNLNIIESNFYDEAMLKAFWEKDASFPFILIQDTKTVKIPNTLPQNIFRSAKDYVEKTGSGQDYYDIPIADYDL